MKANISVCFISATGEEHFLLQCLNIGTSSDDLKFVFTDPASGIGGAYQANVERFGEGDLIRLVPEITYHGDGSLLFKMPSYHERSTTEYRNPQQPGYRRTPLDSIDFWEGFLVYRVHSYDACKKMSPSNPVFLDIAPEWFDGQPLEVRFFLGSKRWPTPIPSETIEVERLTGFSERLDLVLHVQESRGEGLLSEQCDSDHSTREEGPTIVDGDA